MAVKRDIGMFLAALLAVSVPSGSLLADTDRLLVNATRYDQEYPIIQYSGPATHNRIWRLQQGLNSGAIKLEWEPQWGYLRSVLKALEIDVSSQTLVFSKTSLQTTRISEQTPRAIYYNEDTYVGYVQNSTLLEFTAVDADVGVVFFGMQNVQTQPPVMEREGGRCLTCHDTYSMMGGGVPRVLAMSSPVDVPEDTRMYTSASDVDDRTPISKRWGGWYVSGWYLPGKNGPVDHFGNLPLRLETSREVDNRQLTALKPTRDNRGNLKGYFDTDTYLSDKSDVAALLVLEHQTYIQNLISRVNFKVRTIMSRDAEKAVEAPRDWESVNSKDTAAVKSIIEPLVRALFMTEQVTLDGEVVSNSGYREWFPKVGPHDSRGRSLRDLQLDKRLFRYPLSYMIYTESFEALPPYVRDYVYSRIAEVLQGRDTTGLGQKLSEADRTAISQILAETRPGYAKLLSANRQVAGSVVNVVK
jgi:hypothetical protein